ncbi:hypothetical protein [Proteiniphilum acetatigenes]|uniref:hypothetical protein n=1 Tax=Proteiniphilum acetatigenes TaxID=294710 RepID=UPI000364F9A1|nr:hypothetical protein [Proteiniphilum acetatigenes]SEA34754.1 hypothetical protein SAMN05216331_13642 [Porphyromonadaceae bacterium KH3R12]
MSLETVLQIGKVLRNSENSLKYFKYVEPCPKDKDGNWPICITIPVKEDFSFDWEGMKITPENQREKLYYLRYSTSDNDSSPKKYLFGDICYARKSEIDKTGKIKGIKDFGNFTFEKGQGNAFLNGQKAYEEIIRDFLADFIISNVLSAVEKNNIAHVLKFVLDNFKQNKIIGLPKKLSGYSQIIETAIMQLRENEKNNDLAQFHDRFGSEIEKFNRLLLFAPVFETYINDKDIIKASLSNLDDVQEYYLKVIKNNNQNVLKKLLSQGESLDSYSDETKKRFLQFADFSIFIHFEYIKGDEKISWHQFEKVFDAIKDKLNSEVTNLTANGLVPSKNIYRTLCSGNEKNDIQFPAFGIDNGFKSFAFKNKEQFEDFLYTGSILNKSFRRLKYTNIDMFVYPVAFKGEEISAKDYDDFFFNKKDETRVNNDPVFLILYNEGTKRFNRFDFVFADSGGNTTNDLIEISGIEKSALRTLQSRIETIANEVDIERRAELNNIAEFNKLQIEVSFRNLLGNTLVDNNGRIIFKANSKYQSHLLKVLPLIYTANYYNDDLILPSFIQTSEYIVRNVEKKKIGYNYADLKYHLKFLLKIQNTKNDRFMEITSSESYQIGFMLGEMAKNLSLEINSFEKNYVGNLTRRIGTLPDFIKLKNEIEQKLIMHDKARYTFQTSYDLAQKIKGFKSRYDKEECAFGFMESYFRPIPKKDITTSAETNTINN